MGKPAFGVIATIGFTGVVEAADAMLKAAPVTIREVHEVG